MTRESEFFKAVARRNVVRPRVAAIIIFNGNLLVQRPSDDPAACHAFIGGEYEVGDTLASRLRTEIEEETTARLLTSRYLFVVENRFQTAGGLVHGLEHYFLADIESGEVSSREPHLLFRWLPLERLSEFDLRPHIVRDAIISGEYLQARHFVVRYSGAP